MSYDRRKRSTVVYICSPFSDDPEGNTEKAVRFCKYAADHGFTPVAPHLMYPRFLNDQEPADRAKAIKMDLNLLQRCHQLWVFGDNVTSGMRIEMDFAKARRIPIRRISEEEVTGDHRATMTKLFPAYPCAQCAESEECRKTCSAWSGWIRAEFEGLRKAAAGK